MNPNDVMADTVHWGINPPLKHHLPISCQAPPPPETGKLSKPPHFLSNPPSKLVFREPPLKVRSFSEPSTY